MAFNNALLTGTDDVFDDVNHVAHLVRADDLLVPVLLPLGNGLLAAVKKGE